MKRYLAALAAVLVMVATSYAGVQLQPGVARVSLIHGDVTMQRGDSGDWMNATLNTPLVAGDKVATGVSSRAEIQLDYANVLRLADNANASIADLTRDRIQVQIGLGLADFSQLRNSDANIEIDTPNVAVRPLRPGIYRIQVNSSSETQVIVREGEAEVTTPQGSTRVQSGQLITIEGTSNPEYQTVSAPGKDDWDRWNRDRDSLITRAESWRYTNRYYTGSEDLDDYGHWVYVPDYGRVWSPVVGPGWAPYSDGRWVWEPYYGWTWVSYEPWGWAPYHYGRWFLYGASWCWWPGPIYPTYYPVWAPAYVSFFGFGFHSGGFAFGFGFGNIGWLPIGPGDYYHPWYGRGVNVVNVTNITNITNVYNYRNGVGPLYRGRHPYYNVRGAEHNPRILNAVATMPARDFGRMPVRRAGGVNAATFRQAGLLTCRVPVVPSRESLRPTDRPVRMNTRIASNQRFFSKGRPTAAPTPFSRQVAHMENVMRTSAPRVTSEANRLGLSRQQPGPVQMNRLPARAQIDRSPGQQFGRNAGRPAENMRPAQAASDRPGWQRFGGSPAQGNQSRIQRDVGNQGNFARSQGNVNRGARTTQPPATRSGWSSFSRGPGNERAPIAGRNQDWRQGSSRPAGNYGQNQRDTGAARSPRIEQAPGGNQGGWRRFSQTPEQQYGQPRNVGPSHSYGQDGARGGNMDARPGWQRFPSRSESPRAVDSGGYSRGQSGGASRYERPPLDLRQPIVTRRPSYGGYDSGRGAYGGTPRGDYGGGRSVYRGNPGGNYGGGRNVYRGGNSGGSYGGRGAAPAREYRGGGGGGRGASSAPRSSGQPHR